MDMMIVPRCKENTICNARNRQAHVWENGGSASTRDRHCHWPHSLSSTTLKGGGSLQYVPNQNSPYKATWIPGNQIPRSDCALVSKALQACQLLASDSSGHRTGGNCGENVAAMAFCTVDLNGSLVGAKVVTWGEVENVQSVLYPCEKHKNDLSSAPTWGCLSFTRQLGMIVIGKGTNPSARIIPAFTATFSVST